VLTQAGPRANDIHTNDVHIVVHTAIGVHRWLDRASSLPFDATAGSPWLLLPPPVRAAFNAVAAAGVPLADTVFGSPMLGVKCGCNAAFVVTGDGSGPGPSNPDAAVVAIRASGACDARGPARRGPVERAMLRPVVRGQTLARWAQPAPVWDASHCDPARRAPQRGQEWIIWTHDPESDLGGPLRRLPPHAAQWLAQWRHRLAARSDTRGRLPWWALFRTESACSAQPRVVWADLGRMPRAAVLPARDASVPLNSCYVARAPGIIDAQALTALLNSAPAAAWLNALAEPARGGYRRYMGWTVALLPIPQPWERARSVMAPIAARAAHGTPPSESHLTATVAAAYGVDLAILQPLLAWSGA